MNEHFNPNIYWTHFTLSKGSIHLAASDNGLVFVGSLNHPFEELEEWMVRRFPRSTLMRSDSRLLPYSTALMEYFQGRRNIAPAALDLHGTHFQKVVWKAIGEVPYGETRTYSELAALIGKPAAVRAVSAAVGANPALIFIPCHRIIGKNGKLTGYRGGLKMKEDLLALESIHDSSKRELLQYV